MKQKLIPFACVNINQHKCNANTANTALGKTH